MIKQFNFYDFYGYLLPGMLILGLFWLPLGVLTRTWPDQDLSKALFLAVLAYIAGQMLQTIANSVVPSTTFDGAKRQRMPSDLLLDRGHSKFSNEVKQRLSDQVKELFGLDLGVTQDGDGINDISKNRQAAFFQARSYLIAKKAAQYAEQYQGLYAMMRGLGVSFLAGAMYIAGWGLSFHRNNFCLLDGILILLWIAIGAALISALVALYYEAAKKNADRFLAGSLIVALVGWGFVAGTWRLQSVANAIPSNSEPLLWGSSLLALVAAARCFSAYRVFARAFAETVWLDFSAFRSSAVTPASSIGDATDES